MTTRSSTADSMAYAPQAKELSERFMKPYLKIGEFGGGGGGGGGESGVLGGGIGLVSRWM